MPGPVDEEGRGGSVPRQIAIREEIKAIMQKQKDEEKARKKALAEQIHSIMEKQREEDVKRKKALEEQINAILQKQTDEEDERKRSVREQIADKMSAAREEHIKKHHPDVMQKRLEFLPDPGDSEARKGHLKLHILSILKTGPSHGYEIMHRISHHTGHLWRPSPGSMYPALESLEAKGFITCQGDGRRKIYSLTPKGEEAIGQIIKKRQEQFLAMKGFLSGIFDE